MNIEIERVAGLFASEALDMPVTRRDEVPHSYAAITDAWLTDVLCRDHRGAAVIAHSFDERDDGSSNRRRIMLEYNSPGRDAGLPVTVFCKAAETLNNRLVLGLSRAAQIEADFYNLVRGRMEIEAPEGLYASFDPENFASLIMLRDLRGAATFCDDRTEMTRELAEQQIRTLANLHSRFYQSPELSSPTLPFITWPQWWARMMAASPDFEACCDRAFGQCEDIMPARLFARRSEIWPATMASVAQHDNLPQTLIHCDVHLKNWYIANDGAMGLSDWQITTVGHWSRDLIYTMTTALTIDNRRAWEKDLVELYLDLMAERGVPREPIDQVWAALRQQLMSALAFWTITLCPAEGMPDMQPLRTTREFLNRLLTAIDDHASLDACLAGK
ncbi:thiamine kinase-like enzyme [Novosphingobium hassiacum]|uniref:Thiamine kinase-like enzyme n=1 Tax=Novosphingobium hassiacum TaxID=173676 RepID=A0A7W5ZZM6_9SPHN|nr:phosphotransferase [Novosphingobium hassiacum]MBB3862119.1 thiamine kinase-like enzyme [Novosphingobium hassiacum]